MHLILSESAGQVTCTNVHSVILEGFLKSLAVAVEHTAGTNSNLMQHYVILPTH